MSKIFVYVMFIELLHKYIITQPDSHYIRYTAANALRVLYHGTPEGRWLMCAW